jgi:glycosyltransferase involved in cell wall biosynthesis
MSVGVSVVIPTYQRRASVLRLLRALCRQSLSPAEFEVVVCIDGSDDGTRESVDAFDAPFALTSRWQSNRGRASACNAGIGLASGDVVVLLDDDMVPRSSCLEAHRDVHARSDDQPLLVIGAAPVAHDDSSPPIVRYWARKFDEHLERLARPGHEFAVRDVYMGNASVSLAVIKQVGAFDEAFRMYGNEDLELAVRLRRAGVRIAFSRDATAEQHYDKSFAALANDTVAQGRTAVEFAAKHPDLRGELQLAQRERASRQWRGGRDALVRASVLAPATRNAVIAVVSLLERTRRDLDLSYKFVLDYCYWLGATQALRDAQVHSRRRAVA